MKQDLPIWFQANFESKRYFSPRVAVIWSVARPWSHRKFRIAAKNVLFNTSISFFFFFFQKSIDRQRCVDQAPDETRRRVGRWITITRGTRPAWRTSRWQKWSRTRTSRSISILRPPRPYSTAICWPILELLPSPPYWPVICQRRPFCDLSFTYETDQFASGWVFRVASRENIGNYLLPDCDSNVNGGPVGSMFLFTFLFARTFHGFGKKRVERLKEKKVSSKSKIA